jgi:hypothetical protein
VPRVVRSQNYENVLGGVYAGLGAFFIVGGVLLWEDDRPLAVTWISGLGASSVATGTSLLLGQDTIDFYLPLVPEINTGTVMLGFALSERSRREQPVPELTGAGVAFATLGNGLLYGINQAARYGSVDRLRAHRKKFESPSRVSEEELLRIESDFLATDGPIALWVVRLPIAIGSAVALAPAFDDSYQGSQRLQSGIWGGVGLVLWFWSMFGTYPVDYYRRRLDIGTNGSNLHLSGYF